MPTEKRASIPHGLGSNKKSRSTSDIAGKDLKDNLEKTNSSLYFELEADADYLDELQAMYDTAEAVFDEPSKCIPLLRGVVHECNALQNGDANEDQEEDEKGINERATVKRFPAHFYCIFAESLFNLAIMENPITIDKDHDIENSEKDVNEEKREQSNNDEDDLQIDKQKVAERNDFLKAAKRKIDEGLEEHPFYPPLLSRRAQITCALAANGDDFASLELTDHVSSFLETCNEAECMKAEGQNNIDDMVDFLDKLLEYKEEAVDPESAKKLIEALLSVFEDFLEDHVESNDGVSLLKIDLMNSLAEAELESGKSQEVQKFLAKSIDIGEDFLGSHQSCLLRGNLICALGESHMLLGSAKALDEDESGELIHSQKAVEKFEAAKDLGVHLDKAIEEFIADVKQQTVACDKKEEDFTVIPATQ